jgi:ABC transporter substrate binding protein
MCELLHTASANQTCDSTILLWEQAPLGLNAQRPPITGVPGAQIGGPFSGETRLRTQGRAAARLDSEQFNCVQKNSGLPQGLARPLGSRLSVRQETPRLLGSHSWEEGARSDVKRREFITLLGSAVAWPLAASAQQTPKLRIIGCLSPTTASVENQRIAAFVQRLRAAGWIEGRFVAIKVRWPEGRSERAAEIVAEFVQQKVDVIVSRRTVSVLAAKQATPVIPIVFAGGDPVGTGFVVMGGNVTGLSFQQTDLASKRLELLCEVVPALRRLAILANAGNPVTLLDMRKVEAAAGPLGLTVVTVEIRRMEDTAPGFA